MEDHVKAQEVANRRKSEVRGELSVEQWFEIAQRTQINLKPPVSRANRKANQTD